MRRPQDHKTPSLFLDPGDRFVPTRSLMDIGRAQSLLSPLTEKRRTPGRSAISPSRDEYVRRLEETMAVDEEGRPYRMLVFRGSPRNGRKGRAEFEEEELGSAGPRRRTRRLPRKPDFILDGPNLADDYYRNLVDWSTNNILAVALGSSLYLWDATSRNAECLFSRNYVEDHPTSVAWSADGRTLAIGFKNSRIELWDAETLHRVRTIEKHRARVGSLSWNCNVLTSGSQDASIINHDVRISRRPASYYMGHKGNVCGLRWSENGSQLASGGGDSLVHVYESSNTSKYLHRFDGHCAAVRALAWCPFKSKLLASGGGSTADRSVKLWDTNSGECINSIDTGAQVCALEWNRHEKEILSAHGYSKYRLNLWAYPSMHKSAEFVGHTGRVLHMSQNPEGSMVVSAGADEALLFWKIFEPPPSSISRRNTDESDSPLSLKRMHIR